MWMKASRFCICRASSRSRCVPIAFSCRACLKRAGERNKMHFTGKNISKLSIIQTPNNEKASKGRERVAAERQASMKCKGYTSFHSNAVGFAVLATECLSNIFTRFKGSEVTVHSTSDICATPSWNKYFQRTRPLRHYGSCGTRSTFSFRYHCWTRQTCGVSKQQRVLGPRKTDSCWKKTQLEITAQILKEWRTERHKRRRILVSKVDLEAPSTARSCPRDYLQWISVNRHSTLLHALYWKKDTMLHKTEKAKEYAICSGQEQELSTTRTRLWIMLSSTVYTKEINYTNVEEKL